MSSSVFDRHLWIPQKLCPTLSVPCKCMDDSCYKFARTFEMGSLFMPMYLQCVSTHFMSWERNLKTRPSFSEHERWQIQKSTSSDLSRVGGWVFTVGLPTLSILSGFPHFLIAYIHLKFPFIYNHSIQFRISLSLLLIQCYTSNTLSGFLCSWLSTSISHFKPIDISLSYKLRVTHSDPENLILHVSFVSLHGSSLDTPTPVGTNRWTLDLEA